MQCARHPLAISTQWCQHGELLSKQHTTATNQKGQAARPSRSPHRYGRVHPMIIPRRQISQQDGIPPERVKVLPRQPYPRQFVIAPLDQYRSHRVVVVVHEQLAAGRRDHPPRADGGAVDRSVRPREEVVQGRVLANPPLPYPRFSLYVQPVAEIAYPPLGVVRVRERPVPGILYRREQAYDPVDYRVGRAEEGHVEQQRREHALEEGHARLLVAYSDPAAEDVHLEGGRVLAYPIGQPTGEDG